MGKPCFDSSPIGKKSESRDSDERHRAAARSNQRPEKCLAENAVSFTQKFARLICPERAFLTPTEYTGDARFESMS